MKRMTKVAIMAMLAISAIGVGAGAATAAGVTVMGGPTFTASSTDWAIASGSVSMHCTSSSAAGAAVPGTFTAPAVVANITSFTVTGCTLWGVSGTVTTTASTSNPWPLTAGTVTGTGATGTISNVGITFVASSLGCTIAVSGSAPVSWNNNQTLTFTGGSGLSVSSSGFCVGWGSTGTVTGNYGVTASPAINIGPAQPGTLSGGPSLTASSTDSALGSGSISVHCDISSASGAVVPGSFTVPATVASISSLTFLGCTAFGVPATVTTSASTSNPWPLTATAVTSAGATGTVSNVNAVVSVPDLGCTVTVTGSTAGTFDNASQVLTFTGGSGLSVSSSGFCIGISGTGNFTGHFGVSASPAISVS